MSWHDNLIEKDDELRSILNETRRIAVVGIKDESRDKEAAHTVPAYLREHGYEIIPVNPKFQQVFGQDCYASLDQVDQDVDAVLVFRAPGNIPPHAEEVLGMGSKPKTFWMQTGIRNMGAAHKLADAGIKVIQDHCMYQEHLRLIRNN